MKALDTKILSVGLNIDKPAINPDSPPIYHATAFEIDDNDDYDFANKGGKYFYNRSGNYNRDMLSQALSDLEGGEISLITSSGMAAIATTLLGLLASGDHIIVNQRIYGETIELMDIMLKKFGIIVDYVDFTDLNKIKAAVNQKTKIIYTEIIGNPLIEIVDIDEIVKIAKINNIITVVDNTFTTPLIINPLKHGVDVVIHSLTKFIGGHSDITAGSITTSKKLMKIIEPQYRLLGCCLDANSAWLALRSIRTMKLRVVKQMENADKLAHALVNDHRVKYVNYPSINYHPQYDLANKLFVNGFGAMLSFEVEDDDDKVNQFIRKLKLVRYLGTLGGYHTSLAHPNTAFKQEFTAKKLKELGMEVGLIRISCGLEDSQDIIDDIKQALSVFE